MLLECQRREDWTFFPEMTMTKLDWLKLVSIKGIKKTRIEHYGLPLPRFAQYLRTWGETGTVRIGKDGKMGDRGVKLCLLVTPPITRGLLQEVEPKNQEGFIDT
jgi:hypothetical protein